MGKMMTIQISMIASAPTLIYNNNHNNHYFGVQKLLDSHLPSMFSDGLWSSLQFHGPFTVCQSPFLPQFVPTLPTITFDPWLGQLCRWQPWLCTTTRLEQRVGDCGCWCCGCCCAGSVAFPFFVYALDSTGWIFIGGTQWHWSCFHQSCSLNCGQTWCWSYNTTRKWWVVATNSLTFAAGLHLAQVAILAKKICACNSCQLYCKHCLSSLSTNQAMEITLKSNGGGSNCASAAVVPLDPATTMDNGCLDCNNRALGSCPSNF